MADIERRLAISAMVLFCRLENGTRVAENGAAGLYSG